MSILAGGKSAGADINQQRRSLTVPVLRRKHQRRPTILHPRVNRGTIVGQRVNDLRLPHERRQQQRRIQILTVIWCQLLDRLPPSFRHPVHQRDEALVVLELWIRALP